MPCLAVLLVWGALPGSAAEPAPAKPALDNLIKNSPFGSASSPGVAGPESGQLEFRGTFIDNGEQFFSFYEPSTRQSQWVGVKETGTPYTVQSYDGATQTVKVQYRGQALTLTLKRAQIIVQALPPPLPTNPTQAGPQPAAGTVAGGAPAPSGDEAARLAQVADEIRRRRALRAQGTQLPSAPAPAVSTGAAGAPLPIPNRP